MEDCYGIVTVHDTVVGLTAFPLSSDASVILQLKSDAAGAEAPSQVSNVAFRNGDGSPPSLMALPL